jgi:hypothetical protein
MHALTREQVVSAKSLNAALSAQLAQLQAINETNQSLVHK